MKILLLSFLLCTGTTAFAQTQIVTTGNNVMDASNPYAADVVIGSDAAGGTRHDSSIMWWSNGSASRISTTGHTFNFSVWSAPQTPNVSLASEVGNSSYMMGNLGVGTQNPTERLVVNGNLKVILDQATFPAKNVTGIVALGYSGITGAQNWALRGVYQHGFRVGNNADGGDLDVIKSLNGNTVLATKTDGTAPGNVGIGITNPAERLAVNGIIRAREIKVEASNWPDYVFEEGYQVGTLQKLESYIKANKHLPGMPNAKEVETNGIAVSEMLKLQQQKIEELTLYLIEKDKKIDALIKRVVALENNKPKTDKPKP